MCMRMRMYVYLYLCVCVCICIFVYVCTCVCVCVYVCICMYVYVVIGSDVRFGIGALERIRIDVTQMVLLGGAFIPTTVKKSAVVTLNSRTSSYLVDVPSLIKMPRWFPVWLAGGSLAVHLVSGPFSLTSGAGGITYPSITRKRKLSAFFTSFGVSVSALLTNSPLEIRFACATWNLFSIELSFLALVQKSEKLPHHLKPHSHVL